MTPKRIYLTRDPSTGEERLVRAVNQAQARAHIARELEVSVATQDQLVALLTGEQMVEVEDAGAEPYTGAGSPLPCNPIAPIGLETRASASACEFARKGLTHWAKDSGADLPVSETRSSECERSYSPPSEPLWPDPRQAA